MTEDSAEDSQMGWVDAAAESLLEPVTDPNARLLSALLEVNAAEGGVDEFAPLLAQLACSVSDADGAAIELVDGKDMLYIASTGMLAGSEGTRVSRDGSLSGLVIITATPQVSPDITRDTRVDRAACERLGIASMAILPIRHSGHTVAVLKVSAREAGAITEDTLRSLDPLVSAVSVRMAQGEAAQEASARLEMMRTVASASKSVLLADDPGACLLEAVVEITGAPYAYLLEPDGDVLRFTKSYGVDLPDFTVPLDQVSICGSVLISEKPRGIADGPPPPEAYAPTLVHLADSGVTDVRSAVYVPLITPDGPVGVLSALMHLPITAAEAEILGLLQLLAAEAGVAITRDTLRRRLVDEARTDALTGVANRRVWTERLAHEQSRSARSGQPLALAMLDLDLFKKYNDSLGHPAGDALLVAAAKAWATVLRPTDLLARLGGEEFGVLLPETDLASAVTIAERLGAAVPANQTASIGVTVVTADEAPEAAMSRADQALYDAKESGRNRVRTK